MAIYVCQDKGCSHFLHVIHTGRGGLPLLLPRSYNLFNSFKKGSRSWKIQQVNQRKNSLGQHFANTTSFMNLFVSPSCYCMAAQCSRTWHTCTVYSICHMKIFTPSKILPVRSIVI
jgi:hypothetical protein